MRIFIDADGCPVTESAINFAKQHNIECYVVCDTSHEFSFNYASVITVSKGKDSADYKIVNLISPGDIVVTQDYGLAAMCLAKNARAINQNGLIYTDNNIATVYKGNIIKNLIMDCQSYAKYRPNETTGGIFVSWRRKEELPMGA